MDVQVELVSIGNELVSGRTLNTHGRDLGGALEAIGIRLMRDTTITDNIQIISATIKEALKRTDLVFVSGGLGPTVDDVTRQALMQLLDRKIVLHQPTVCIMAERYAARGRGMTAAAERQALVLENATVLPNPVGAAPGQRIDLPDGKILFVLPGPPNEFNGILNEHIIPWLKQHYAHARPNLVRIVHTKGIGESDIVTILEAASFQPSGIDLGFYPGKGRVEIRLSALPGHESQITAAEHALHLLLADHLDSDQ